MTTDETKTAVAQLIADAETIPASMGDTDEHEVVVKVGLLRAVLEQLN